MTDSRRKRNINEPPQTKFERLTREYATSVREYFMVLRLAIYHTTGDFLEKSHEIAQYEKTDEIYKTASRILNVLNWGRA